MEELISGSRIKVNVSERARNAKKTSEERNTKGLKFVVEMLQYCVVNCN